MNKKKLNFKTVLVFVIVILTGVLLILGVNATRTYLSGADAGIKPENVLAIASSDGRSATITWTTNKPSISMIGYGTSPANTLLRAGNTDMETSHTVKVDTLRPGTTYYFKIIIGSEEYMENGVPYSFKTPTTDKELSPMPNEEEVVPTVVVPTVVPSATPTLTSNTETNCDRLTDYNSDGVVNSLDYYHCLKSVSDPSATPTPTVAGACDSKKDNNGDGVVNSLDALWCLQNVN